MTAPSRRSERTRSHRPQMLVAFALFVGATAACSTNGAGPAGETPAPSGSTDDPSDSDDAPPPGDSGLADVTAVSIAGEPGSYTFSVTVRSPDLGCEQYADWWEVLRPDGTLVARRPLAHSHVDEQPFTRSTGPIELEAGDEVVVRAHMNPGGYGGAALRGTAGAGFEAVELAADFAAGLAAADPQPPTCAF